VSHRQILATRGAFDSPYQTAHPSIFYKNYRRKIRTAALFGDFAKSVTPTELGMCMSDFGISNRFGLPVIDYPLGASRS